jgi:hypothetical protein
MMGNKTVKRQNYTIPTDCLDCSSDIVSNIEQLASSISELLSNTSRNSKLANVDCIAGLVKQILDATEQRVKDDACHDFKRRIGFEILDGLLRECSEGRCPNFDPAYHKCLIDVSIEGYILKRAYYYSADEEEKSETDDYYRAVSRIRQVFSCPSMPMLSDELFEIDSNDLHDNPEHHRGAERRKAFWRYLSRRDLAHNNNGDHRTDYCDSCGFLGVITSNDSDKLNKSFYEDHIDMVNGLDLFRFCIARAKSLHPAAE